jgi:hypothetical protein
LSSIVKPRANDPTENSVATALRGALREYLRGSESLRDLAACVADCARSLTTRDDITADRLRLISIGLNVRASLAEEGYAPGQRVAELIEAVRLIAENLDAQ